MEKGIMCVSIDLELAWGCVDNPTPELCRLALQMERPIIARLLDLFRKYEISATWAIVAGLLEKDSKHPQDSPEEIWYAPDVVEQIRNASPSQEIGSHSFGHCFFSEIDEESAATDLDAARRIHKEHGLEFVSFIFPKHLYGHLDLLASHGLKVFRSGASAEVLARFGRVGRFADKFLPLGPLKVEPVLHKNGLLELPSSMMLMGREGLRKLVVPEIHLIKARRGIEAAARERSLFHFWFHPSNFYYGVEVQFRILEGILALAADMRNKGKIDILPMKDFVAVSPGSAGRPADFRLRPGY